MSRKISKKFSNIKFHENPSSGSQVVPCGHTHTQTERDKANSRFSPKNQKTVDKHYAENVRLCIPFLCSNAEFRLTRITAVAPQNIKTDAKFCL